MIGAARTSDPVDATRDADPSRLSDPRSFDPSFDARTSPVGVDELSDTRCLDIGLAVATRSAGLTFIVLPAPVVRAAAIVDAFRDPPIARDTPSIASTSIVAWSSEDLVLVGVGVAREVRGAGESRWAQVIADAHAIATDTADVDDEPRDTLPTRVTRDRPCLVGERRPIANPVVEPRPIDGPPVEPRPIDVVVERLIADGSIVGAARAIDNAPVRAVIDGQSVPIAQLGFARPRFVGGAAFAPGSAERAPWTGFGDAWFVLPRWTYVHDGTRAVLVLAVDSTTATDANRWHEELAMHRAAFARETTLSELAHASEITMTQPPLVELVPAPELPMTQPPLVELAPAPAAMWRAQVTAITDAIARGTCSKIVAARMCDIQLAGPVRLAALLAALDDRHAECVRVLIKPPGAAALVAATPERLVRRDSDVVTCDALAGSIASGDANAVAQLFASTKDRNEHELVVDAIRVALAGAGAEVSAPSTPAVKRLRHVIHLHTPFHATLRAPHHVLDLAARLHPTPAVGGTPSALARTWIEEHEPAPRGWYAAPVGWFDLDGNGELAVALRSGVIDGDRAHLWAGAGIVAGSDPDRELAETEMKLRAMLGALGVAP